MSNKKIYNVNEIAEYCKTHYANDDINTIIKKADEIVNNTFIFSRRWDMEASNFPVTFQDKIGWDYIPRDDLEWPVMLARQSYLYDVTYAYILTGDTKYYDCFIRIVTDFIDNCKFDTSPNCHSWRTIDTGIRAVVWILCMELIEEKTALPQDFLEKVKESLIFHSDYLYDTDNDFHQQSNWGVILNNGGIHTAIYLQNRYSMDYSERLKVLLDRMNYFLNRQILPDGVHWEQSPMYHNEVLWSYLELMHLLEQNNMPITKYMKEQVYKMCIANCKWSKPNHHQPMQSDSDDTDLRDILTYAAWIFKSPKIKAYAYSSMDIDTLFKLGYSAIKEYNNIEIGEQDLLNLSLEESGNYYFRSSKDENSAWLNFRCGTIGSGHGHADTLGIMYYADGEDILVDSGRYTYVNKDDRILLKLPQAHNCVTMDNESFTDCVASWDFGKIAKTLRGHVFENEEYAYVYGSHLGYISKNIISRRDVIFIKPNIVVIYDSFYGTGKHTFTQHFHFDGIDLTKLTDNSVLYKGKNTTAVLTSLSSNNLKIKPSAISRHYNQIEKNISLDIECEQTDGGSMLTVMCIGKNANAKVTKLTPILPTNKNFTVTDKVAEALKIETEDNNYRIIFARESRDKMNMFKVEECIGYGEVMIFDKDNNKTVLL